MPFRIEYTKKIFKHSASQTGNADFRNLTQINIHFDITQMIYIEHICKKL